jgi:hypothetical protein
MSLVYPPGTKALLDASGEVGLEVNAFLTYISENR